MGTSAFTNIKFGLKCQAEDTIRMQTSEKLDSFKYLTFKKLPRQVLTAVPSICLIHV